MARQNLDQRLTIRQLRLVVAIAEQKSLVAASQHLHMTRSAVTKALQEAEAILGVPLFQRTIDGAIPTVFAKSLVVHARQIFAQLQQASAEIGDLLCGLNGRLTIGTHWSATAELLPRAICRLRDTQRNISVSVIEGAFRGLLDELRMGKLDLLLGRPPEGNEFDGIHFTFLMQDIACVVVRSGHPLAQRKGLCLGDLADQDWILPRRESLLRRRVEAAFRREGVDPPGHAVESPSVLTNIKLLSASDHLAVSPWQVAKRAIRSDEIVVLPVVLRDTIDSIGITTRLDADASPTVDLMMEMLKSVAQDMEISPLLSDIQGSNF